MNDIAKLATATAMIIFLASCDNKEKPKSQKQAAATIYKTMVLQPRQISGDVRLPGVMQPFQYVKLFSKMNGFVKNVYADRGTIVKKGQVLITLEAPEIEQQVAGAKLKYTQAEATYLTSKDRYRRLLETSKTPGTVAPFDIEAAASKMQGDSATAQGEYANYKAQETMKSYLTVVAPFDGVITERNVHPGALVGPGTQSAKPMLVLQQLSKIRLAVDVPEQYVMQIHEGDKIRYTTNALPGQSFDGTISRTSRSLSENYRSESIEIDVPNGDNRFRPGMYAEVVLPTSGNTHAFVVPVSSVVTTTERKYIIAVSKNLTQWTDVSEGNQNNDSIEVFCNLPNGCEVITNANYQIRNGVAIR